MEFTLSTQSMECKTNPYLGDTEKSFVKAIRTPKAPTQKCEDVFSKHLANGTELRRIPRSGGRSLAEAYFRAGHGLP
jgi:uncharacterized protein YifE (UPF0438 family)